MFAEVFNEEVISLLIEYGIKIIVLIIGTLAIKLITKYSLEKKIRDLVWYAEQIYEKEGMGEYKKEEVVSYFAGKLKMSEKRLMEIVIILEKEVKKLNLLQQKALEEQPIIIEGVIEE